MDKTTDKTSKLGADMTDGPIATTSVPLLHYQDLVRKAGELRTLLARQPAAIDKEAVTPVRIADAERAAYKVSGHRAGEKWTKAFAEALLATPLAKEASKPATSLSHANEVAVAKEYDLDESTVRDLWKEFTGIIAAEASKPAAPSVEQDERGAILRDLMQLASEAFDHTPASFTSRVVALANRARAASTSANVAQGAEAVGWFMQRSKFGPWVEVEQQEPGAEQFYRGAPPAQTALTGRVLTYRNQPDNVGAWQLGDACRRAAELPAGDYIDRGLGLLKELQAKGYGVIALIAAQSASGESRADKA